MSRTTEAVVTCDNCKNTYDVMVHTSVNASLDPELREAIFTGALFKSKCDHCGFINRIDYDVLYHDMKNKFMVWLTLPDHENVIFFQRHTLKLTSKNLGKDYVLRISRYPHHFVEKIRVLESRLDDRLIELYKFLFKIRKEHPVETGNDYLHFQSMSRSFFGSKVIDWRLIYDKGVAQPISEKVNAGDYAFAEKLLGTLEPKLKDGWFMVDWQFPFGQRVHDDDLIKLPFKSEVTEIETGNTIRKLPSQFVDVLERTGRGKRI